MYLVVTCVAAEAAPPSDERTAADVAGAPPAGQESGRIDPPDGESPLLEVGRGVLFVPRMAFELVLAPVRVGLWSYERYGLKQRVLRFFFDDTVTYGVYPTLYYDTTYGVTYGATLLHRDLFGARERLRVRVATGGEFRTLVDGRLGSGYRLGRNVYLDLRGQYEQRPNDRFFGIGNNHDPIEVRYRERIARASATLQTRLIESLYVLLAGAITDLDYEEASEGAPIDAVYGPEMLPGFVDGRQQLYGELELRWDSRRPVPSFSEFAAYHRGAMVSAYAGRVHQLADGGDYWHYGGEAQYFFPLPGVRTLATRLRVESVTGDMSDVAFSQLPRLGGSTWLRGYSEGRFRDDAAVLGTLEYSWDVNRNVLASVFADVGRVYSSLDDFELDEMRLGYGASLQLHYRRRFVSRVSVASSIDGGVFVNLAFDPVFEPEPRVEQK